MDVHSAINSLAPGCECSILTNEPTTQQEYDNNVEYIRGTALPTWTSVDALINDVPTARTNKIKEINIQATTILKESFDYHLVRSQDPDDLTPIPQSAKDYKTTIRGQCNSAETDINGLTDVNTINRYTVDWADPPAT